MNSLRISATCPNCILIYRSTMKPGSTRFARGSRTHLVLFPDYCNN